MSSDDSDDDAAANSSDDADSDRDDFNVPAADSPLLDAALSRFAFAAVSQGEPFPTPVSDELQRAVLDEIYRYERNSNTLICACCAVPQSNNDTQWTYRSTMWDKLNQLRPNPQAHNPAPLLAQYDQQTLHNSVPPGIMLDARGLCDEDERACAKENARCVRLCASCDGELSHGKLPANALANDTATGMAPAQLTDLKRRELLTVQLVIVRADIECVGNKQTRQRGQMLVMDLEPLAVHELPRSINIERARVYVRFPSGHTDEERRQTLKLYKIDVNKVGEAMQWLKQNNLWYQ